MAFVLLQSYSCKSIEKQDLELSPLFSDNMVLQRNEEVAIWGKADAGQKLTINTTWGQEESTKVNGDGTWNMKIKTTSAKGPQQLTVSTIDSTVTFSNVLLGEVWLASGQSNMEMPLTGYLPDEPVDNYEQEIENAENPLLRMFTVKRKQSNIPLDTLIGTWQQSNPENARKFSATAYFFARKLIKELEVPVGIIHSSWGGSEAEAWVSKAGLKEFPEFIVEVEQQEGNVDYMSTESPNELSACLYNGMIHPIIPYTLKGAIWYQGESNIGRAKQYETLFPRLIEDWRSKWNANFSFYYAQIAPYGYNSNDLSADLRDAQRKSLHMEKTGMAILLDIGEQTNIHPGNKQDVGKRLAYLALAYDYGEDIVYSGPLFKKQTIKGRYIYLDFDFIGKGLMTKQNPIPYFEISNDRENFKPAQAKIVGNQIEVFSPQVQKPFFVRYGWKDYLEPTVFNSAGLPMSSFSTAN